ncbi:MAG: hypothetical protein ABSH44_22555 [Bryobacteraceae bacterium]
MPALTAEAGGTPDATLLPTIPLGKNRVTRLVIGSNPFYGYSHFNKILSQHMQEWSTQQHVCETLRRCQQTGINTWQFSHSDRSISDIQRHRADGGTLQWILTTSARMLESQTMTARMAAMKPIAVVHQGVSTDNRWAAGQQDKIREFLKWVRDTGVLAGMASHNPRIIEAVEEQGWDVDFFMCSVYRYNRTQEELNQALSGEMTVGETYLQKDPERMYRVIRQSKKTCFAFKILAAGRLESPQEIDRAFRLAFENIKPQDGVIVGMYPRFSDQVAENAERARRILAAVS